MTEQSGYTGDQAGSGPLVAGDGSRTDVAPAVQSQSRHAYTDTGRVIEREHIERDHTTLITGGSRLRGGPVLGGFVVGFATWILLELALFALDLGALASQVIPGADSSNWWWSGVAAVIGFFIGGLVAGASIPTRRIDDGVLNGITVWAVTVVALVVMSAVGAGIGFGVVGDVLANSSNLAGADPTAVNDAQTAAAAAVLALAVTLAAAAIGGALGSKLWPRQRDTTIDLRR